MKEVYETPWEYDTPPFRITDDIWYVGNTSVAVHLIDTGGGLLLIDTGYPQTAYLLIESIRAAGFDPNAIRWILHTHVHYDHIGATRALVEKYGCKTYLGVRDADILRSRRELTWHPEYDLPFNEGFTPDALVNDGDKLRFGDICIECMAYARKYDVSMEHARKRRSPYRRHHRRVLSEYGDERIHPQIRHSQSASGFPIYV